MTETQCAWCERISDMRTIGEPDGYLEQQCPHCGESTYERTD